MLLDMLRTVRRNGRRLDRLAAAIPTTADRLTLYRRDPARLMIDAGFAPDPWQVQLLRGDAPRSLLLCARQVGKSTVTAALALKTALTQPGSTTIVTAPVEPQANELLRKVLSMHNAIGRPVALLREAVTYLEFANGARVLALPGKERRVRSYSVDLLIVDEAARVLDEVFSAASPTLAVSGGRLVALSTAFAKSGWFYDAWTGDEDYRRLSITARDCPRISPEFLESERRTLGQRWFDMEYLNIFGDDIAAVFSVADIEAALDDERVQPLFAKTEAAA
ncbi:MAG TPA: terminase family protein [Urbifossiella sp.]|nr:terminase family protein [Urbifossiella sp.]